MRKKVKHDPITIVKDFMTAQVGDRKWLYGIAGGLLALGILSYSIVNYLNTKVIYTHPSVRTIKKTYNNVRVVMESGTATRDREGNISATGKFTLIDLSREFEDIKTYPVFGPEKDWIFKIDYLHVHANPDIVNFAVYRRVIWSVYFGVGYSVLINPSLLNPNIETNIENFSAGILVLF